MRMISTTLNMGLREMNGGLRALGAARDVFIVLGSTGAALYAAHQIVHAVIASGAGGTVV